MSRKFLVPLTLLNRSTHPSSPSSGDMYFNTVDNVIYVYNGVSWASGSTTPLIFTGFDGGSATTTVFDLTLDLGAAS